MTNFVILLVGVIVGFLLAIIVKGLIDLFNIEKECSLIESELDKCSFNPKQQWRPPANGEIDVPIDLYVAYKKLESRLDWLEQMAFEKNLNANKKG